VLWRYWDGKVVCVAILTPFLWGLLPDPPIEKQEGKGVSSERWVVLLMSLRVPSSRLGEWNLFWSLFPKFSGNKEKGGEIKSCHNESQNCSKVDTQNRIG